MTMPAYTIRDAFIAAEKIRLEQLPEDNDIAWVPSEKFERKMKRLVRSSSRSYWQYINTSQKRAAIIMASIIILLGFSMSVRAIREPVVQFIIKTYETFTNIFYHNDDTELDLPKTLEQKYTISLLPEGYTFLSEEDMGPSRTVIWENADGEQIFLVQGTIDNRNINLSTDSTSYSYVNVGQYEGIYNIQRNLQTVIWDNDKYVFILICPLTLPYDEFLLIAENIIEEN